jgi:hypothetical protein
MLCTYLIDKRCYKNVQNSYCNVFHQNMNLYKTRNISNFSWVKPTVHKVQNCTIVQSTYIYKTPTFRPYNTLFFAPFEQLIKAYCTRIYICSWKQTTGAAAALKGVWHEIFDFNFFSHEFVSPGPLSIPLGPFQLFLKIRRGNHEWMFISSVNDTGDKLFGGVNDTADRFISGVVDTSN